MTNIASYNAPIEIVDKYQEFMKALADDIVDKTKCPRLVADRTAVMVMGSLLQATDEFIRGQLIQKDETIQ